MSGVGLGCVKTRRRTNRLPEWPRRSFLIASFVIPERQEGVIEEGVRRRPMAGAEIEHGVGRSGIEQLDRRVIVARRLAFHDPRHDPKNPTRRRKLDKVEAPGSAGFRFG
jgi:hypothetical protein